MSFSVERLSRRVAGIPMIFVESDGSEGPQLATDAIVHDVILMRSGEPPLVKFTDTLRVRTRGNKQKRTRRAQRRFVARVAAWILADPAFQGLGRGELESAVEAAMEPVAFVAARQFVDDADRREELVRIVLRALRIPPEGERPEDAEDRMSALDSVRRVRLLREARAAEEARREREKKIAAELAKKRAAEQAARYDREY